MLVALEKAGGCPAMQKMKTWSSLFEEDFKQQVLRNSGDRKNVSYMEKELERVRRESHVQANTLTSTTNQLDTFITMLKERNDVGLGTLHSVTPSTEKSNEKHATFYTTSTKAPSNKPEATIVSQIDSPMAPPPTSPEQVSKRSTFSFAQQKDTGSWVKTLPDLLLFWVNSPKLKKLIKDKKYTALKTSGRPSSISDNKNFAKFSHVVHFIKTSVNESPTYDWDEILSSTLNKIDKKLLCDELATRCMQRLKRIDGENGKTNILGLGTRVQKLGHDT